MRLSFEWLCDYANFSSIPFEKILEKISLSICEVDKVENYSSDKILIIDNKSITHRPDLWSHFGFARELACQLDIPIFYDPFLAKVTFLKNEKLKVISTAHAHSYYACFIQNVSIQESNFKIKTRLEKCGIRSISNVVDVSNYVMLEMGQPTHFFDADTLESLEISVEKGYTTSFSCLDEVVRNLNEDIVVIVNNKTPIAIAGIMGGKETEVSYKTKNLVLESAVFKREDIRKGSRYLEIRTEASIRYEKGLERTTVLPIIHRTIQLLKENGCSEILVFEPVGFIHESNRIVNILTTWEFIFKKLGKIFPKQDILSILKRLGFEVLEKEENLEILVPKYRHNYDVTIPEDIVEEIGRSIGYANIQPVPLKMDVLPNTLQESRNLERKIKGLLAFELGFREVYNYSFASEKEIDFEKQKHKALKILNPMPEESTYLRTSTYPSILHSLRKNEDRFEIISIFEFGRAYFRNEEGGLGFEKKFFTILYYKNYKNESLFDLENLFLEFRDKCLSLLKRVNLREYTIQKKTIHYFHDHSSLEIFFKDKKIMELGILHPKIQKEYEFKKKVFLARIEFENLLEAYHSQKQVFYFQAPSVFPSAYIDISLILEKYAFTETYVDLVQKKQIPEIQAAYVNSIYSGVGIPENKKSVTYRFELTNFESSFTQKQIHEITEQLLLVAKENGFAIR